MVSCADLRDQGGTGGDCTANDPLLVPVVFLVFVDELYCSLTYSGNHVDMQCRVAG